MITSAFVKIWDIVAGAIIWDDRTRLGSFEYDPNFIHANIDLSPLKMSVHDLNKVFSFPELRASEQSAYDTFKGLPGLIADTLPDKYGNQLINAWLAKNGRAEDSLNPIEKLCFIGTRGMGALEFMPTTFKPNKNTFSVEIDSLVDIAQQMLGQKESFSTRLDPEEKEAMLEIMKIGTSAGGARPKAIIAFDPKSKKVRSGQTIAPKGYEHWLIKLDGVSDAQFGESSGWGRVEMAYYYMAIDCGIDMMECQLLEEHDRAHFMTKRFDREGSDIKHHVQTLCAMQHYDFNDVNSYSYEQLFQTMRLLRLSYPEAEQMYRRMVFNVIAKNCDDHTKNFSFRLKQKGKWELSPAYDICYAYRPDSIWVSQQSLSVNGKRKNFVKKDLLQVAASMNINKPELIIAEVQEVVDQWTKYAQKVNLQPKLRERIQDNLLHL